MTDYAERLSNLVRDLDASGHTTDIGGVAITGTPSAGNTIVASSGTAAAWGAGGGGAPSTVNYLVGTADAGLSAEIVVGTTPGGELGNTWASPTVDTTHSGSSHAGTQTAAEATAAAALGAHDTDTTSVHGIANTANLYVAGGTDVAVADGGTGASTAAGARTNLGLTVTTRNLILRPIEAGLAESLSRTTSGTLPDIKQVLNYSDGATNGGYWEFLIPLDWVSGVISIQPIWGPSATDAVAHTVRWSMICKSLAAGTSIDTAGTTVTWTGASAARTVRVTVFDTVTSTTVTPGAAGEMFMIYLRRLGADAADTYVGVAQLFGLAVTYTAAY